MKNKIIELHLLIYIMLFLFTSPITSLAQEIDSLAVPDTTKQDTAVVKPDSIAEKVPLKIVIEDSTFLHYMKSPWKMSSTAMSQYFYEDLGDLLNYFPGISLVDLGSSGQELGMSRHGANDRQTTLYIDNRPFYNPIYGGIDLNFIPVGFINLIRFEQGLSSHFATSNAEIIALKSDNHEAEPPYSRVGYHKAPYGFSDIDIVYGQKISNRTNLLLGGIIKSYDGKTDVYGFEQQNFRGRIDHQLSHVWQFSYSWISNKVNRHIADPVLTNAFYQGTDATQKLSRFDQTLQIKGRIFKSEFKNFQANLYYSSLSEKLKDKNFDIQSTNLGRYAGFNFKIQHRFLGQRISWGGDFTNEWTDADDVKKNSKRFGSVFIQNDWDWKERFGIRILGNYRFHDSHDSQFSGGLSSFCLLNKNFRLTASAKQSLRDPTFFEMYANTNYIGNPSLKPEFHQKIAMGMEWEIDSKFSLTSTIYHKQVQHAIRLSRLDSAKATFLNQNSFQYSGFDVQLKWNILSGFQLNSLLSAIENINLNHQPQITLVSYLQYTRSFFQDDLRPTIRLETRYHGERTSTITHPYVYEIYQENLSPVFILNAHAIFDFGNLKIFITIENIFNQQYQLIHGYPMNERTLHYGLRWEFWN